MKNKFLYITAFIAIAILALVLYSFNISFDNTSSELLYFWLRLSNTAGNFGTVMLCIIVCLAIVILAPNKKKIFGKLLYLLTFIALCVGLNASLNEFGIKAIIKKPRPSIERLAEQYNFNVDEFYNQGSKYHRREVLQQYIDNAQSNKLEKTSKVNKTLSLDDNDIIDVEYIAINGKDIPYELYKHWLKETGYSFPSGHSSNAFLLSFIFSYLFLKINRKYWILAIVFFTWSAVVACSRVIIGVHSVNDVIMGACTGSILGIVLLKLKILNRMDKAIVNF